MIPFSILDLSPIAEGATAADALHRSLDLAQHAEGWGYNRYWLAEHQNTTGIASAATSVVIGYVAGGGTDPAPARALRRDAFAGADRFPEDVQELQGYLEPLHSG